MKACSTRFSSKLLTLSYNSLALMERGSLQRRKKLSAELVLKQLGICYRDMLVHDGETDKVSVAALEISA